MLWHMLCFVTDSCIQGHVKRDNMCYSICCGFVTVSCIQGHVKSDTVRYGIRCGFVTAIFNAVTSCKD